MKILVLIASLSGCVLLHAQTAFNIATHLDNELAFEGLNDIELLENGDVLITGKYIGDIFDLDTDFSYLARIDVYGNIKWSVKVATNPPNTNNSASFGYSASHVNDSSYLYLEVVSSGELFPEYEFWNWTSYVHLINGDGEIGETWYPQTSFPAYRFDEIKYSDDKLFLLGTGISNATNEGLYDWVLISMDLEGNTIAEISLPVPDFINHIGELLILENGDVIIATNNSVDNYYENVTIHRISNDLDEILWSETIEEFFAYSILESNDGNVLIGGSDFYPLGIGKGNARTIKKIDSETGDILWQENLQVDGTDYEIVAGIYESLSGEIYLGGLMVEQFTNYNEAFLLKLNESREIEWEQRYKCFEEQDEEYITNMVATPDGGFLLGGWSRGIDEEQEEIWLIKTDSLGNDSIPIGAYFVQDTLFLNHGESWQMNPIPYGGSNSYTHQWTGNTVYLDETQTWHPTFTGSQAGTYMLTYTATDSVDGNEAMAQIVVVAYPADALTELNPDNWQVYPNPAANEIQINTDYQGEALLKIYAMDGRLLRQASIHGNEIINLQGLPCGLLSLQVYADDGKLLHKAKVLKQ